MSLYCKLYHSRDLRMIFEVLARDRILQKFPVLIHCLQNFNPVLELTVIDDSIIANLSLKKWVVITK